MGNGKTTGECVSSIAITSSKNIHRAKEEFESEFGKNKRSDLANCEKASKMIVDHNNRSENNLHHAEAVFRPVFYPMRSFRAAASAEASS